MPTADISRAVVSVTFSVALGARLGVPVGTVAEKGCADLTRLQQEALAR